MRFLLKDRVAVLTGAASGIGAALARELAANGASLALVDIDEEGLQRIAEELRGNVRSIKTFAMDVTDSSALDALPEAISKQLGFISVLINNAGITLSGRFEQVTTAQFDRVIQTNFAATVNLTRAFLPQLRANPPAQIINMSSIFGIVGVPGQVAYCASKFAVRGFSEALRLELRGSDVGVTVVHPGGVKTNIASRADVGPEVSQQQQASMKITADKLLRIPPVKVAHRIVEGVIRRRKRVVIGADARLLAMLQTMFPASYGSFFPKD